MAQPKILLTRIDDRFIYGQDVELWNEAVGSNLVLIVNDEIAADSRHWAPMRVAAPEGVWTRFFSVQRAIDIIHTATPRQWILVMVASPADALALAEEKELDLVKIAPNAVPPVCKIMDYGKFRFEQLKKEKEAKKNQRVVEVKEIRMSPSIDTNDLNTKIKNAMKFLNDGNRVKVTVRFRGREMAHTSLGEVLLKQFGESCAEVATVEKGAKLEGRNMSMFLSPKNSK